MKGCVIPYPNVPLFRKPKTIKKTLRKVARCLIYSFPFSTQQEVELVNQDKFFFAVYSVFCKKFAHLVANYPFLLVGHSVILKGSSNKNLSRKKFIAQQFCRGKSKNILTISISDESQGIMAIKNFVNDVFISRSEQ